MLKGKSKYDGQFKNGEKYGKWTIIEDTPVFNKWTTTKEYVVKVKCDCECKTEKYVSCRNLKLGVSRGCDCIRRKENNYNWKGVGNIPGKYLSQIEKSAKKRNIKVLVSYEYIWNIFLKQCGKCALSGLDIEFGCMGKRPTASLDRIDSSKGYIDGNVQWVHKDINTMKNKFDVEKFKKLCKMVTNYGN